MGPMALGRSNNHASPKRPTALGVFNGIFSWFFRGPTRTATPWVNEYRSGQHLLGGEDTLGAVFFPSRVCTVGTPYP